MSKGPLPWINTSVPLGKLYDWSAPGEPESGTVYSTLHSRGGVNLTEYHKRVHGKYLSGGGWSMTKHETKVEPSHYVRTVRNGKRVYRGVYITQQAASNPAPSWWREDGGTFPRDIWNQIKNDAANAFNRAKPTRPDFSLGRALYELKDVPGMLRHANEHLIQRIRGQGPRKQSRTEEWYLAIQFGWKPLLDDIRKFVNTQAGMQKRLTQLIRDEGKPVRRRVNMANPWGEPQTPTESGWEFLDSHSYNTNMQPGHVLQAYGTGKSITKYKSTVTVKTWAVGQFRYLLPPGPRDVIWGARLWAALNGLQPTPSEVYRAMPWTWLADFFINLGDFLEATEPGAADLLVADYFYVMNTYEWKNTTTSSQYVYTEDSPTEGEQVTSTCTTTWTNKNRWPATTFGFGLTQNDLSPFQVSILGAIGKSRLT